MAMYVDRSFNIACFCFVQALFCAALSAQITNKVQNPSTVNLQIYDIYKVVFQPETLEKTHYHHIDRRSPLTPTKKASASLEKKFAPKDSVAILTDKAKSEAKNLTADSNSTMTYNSTVLSSSTLETHVESEAHNISTTSSTVSSSNATDASIVTTVLTSTVMPVSSTTITSSSTILSKTSSVTTPFSDVLPTKPSNITNTTVDHHVYYNSTIYLDPEQAMTYWVNFDTLPQNKVVVHRMLSDSHRRAATVTLSFDFPFYGHPLRNITIATGGFVYMGDYMHSWLAATQYIAPLMANFDTSLSEESTVRYFDNGTAFVIEWHEVTLQDGEKGGNFTFQTTLLNNGNIIFVYETIPVSVTEIGDEAHPVKVGLSDAYVIDKIIYFIRRKTIYEYHRIDMKKEEIGNHTAIYFTALTTCLSYRSCNACMAADVGFDCIWCEAAKRCSDGLDRLRHDWLQSKCDVQKNTVNCSALPSPNVNPYVQPLTDAPSKTYTIFPRTPVPDHSISDTSTVPYLPDKTGRQNADSGASTGARVAEDDSTTVGVGSVVAILLILALVMGALVWVGYAYRNPHTASGQLLIRYRPSQWRFRSGEARYTAASVHM